jgi:hypothetical protein
MRIPRFWAKVTCSTSAPDGQPLRFQAWGWSPESQADAEEAGRKRALQIQARFQQGRTRSPQADYDYLDLPLREEIVDEIGPAGESIAVITRNRYGALILNASSVLFADIDFPPPRSRGFIDAIRMALSASHKADRIEETRQNTLSAVKSWISRHPEHPLRMYRTAAGLRLLFTDKTYDPASSETLNLLQELGSDPLYIRLTLKQESFRARLTPKPWRCGAPPYPVRFPFMNDRDSEAARQWRDRYTQLSANHRVCDLVSVSGRESIDPAIKAVVELHDRYSCNPKSGKLA